MHKAIAALLGASLTGSLACSTEGTTADADVAGSAGSAGSDPAGTGGTSSTEPCPSDGLGKVDIQITGLPAGVAAQLRLSGPGGSQEVTAATTLEGLDAGNYTLSAERVADSDPIVRTLYDYELGEQDFCLSSGGTHTVQLDYAAVPTSHRLWTNNSNGEGNLLAFSASVLSASASTAPTVAVNAGAGKDVAFDADGNLWSMGATLADPHLMRFPAGALEASGDKTADRGINLSGVSCIPALRAFAFDANGALWVSICGGRIVQLGPADLAGSGDVSPALSLDNLTDNGDLAFDADGNLWVTDDGAVRRYDAARLGASSGDPANLTLRVRDNDDARDVVPSNLAFDASGDLWLIDFGGNLLARIDRAQLSGSGEQSALSEVTLALSVTALLERPAFDESGGLWLALEQNRFGRLAPAQLLLSSTPGAPTEPETLITSPNMGNANRMAFFPAAAALPLFHHFR